MGKSAPPPIFDQLRSILLPYAAQLKVAEDNEVSYSLDAPCRMPNKKPLFFGAARIGRAYVSYHLMPVYIAPELLAGMSSELKRRMQGKSCFNFTKPDAALFAELARLTQAGFDSYRKAGYVGK